MNPWLDAAQGPCSTAATPSLKSPESPRPLRSAELALANGDIDNALNELLEYAEAQMTNPDAGPPEENLDFEKLFEQILEKMENP